MDGYPADMIAAIEIELARLGLDAKTLPGLALGGSPDHFIKRLRDMQPGVTWSDIFPGVPKNLLPGQSLGWPQKYVPKGAYDYQELPTAPAIQIAWDKALGNAVLDAFLTSARAAGWPIYGAGLLPMSTDSQWPTNDALVILIRGTDTDVLYEFRNWIEQRTDVRVALIARDGSEKYAHR